MIREPISEIIRKTHPDWSPSGYICIVDLNQFRAKYVKDVLETEKGELSTLEKQVLEVHSQFFRRVSFMDSDKLLRIHSEAILSIPIYSSQFGPFMSCCITSTHHYDESKPAGGQRSFTVRA